MENAQNDETIISTIYMKTDFPIIKKKITLPKIIRQCILNVWCFRT